MMNNRRLAALETPRPSTAERRALGKALRERLPRRDQGRWTVDERRRGGLVETLTAAVAGRRADLLPIRWGRMVASPFGFYRGAAALMAADLGPKPTCGIEVQVCGDAHVLNLGAYAAADGHLVFDLNDFDEACRGPFEWDLKRLAASVTVAGRFAGRTDRVCADAVRAMVRTYRGALARFGEMPILELARLEITPRSAPGRKSLAPFFRQAARNTPAQLLKKVAQIGTDGFATFRDAPPLLRRLAAAEAARVLGSLAAYRGTLGIGRQQVLDGYRPRDLAFKVVGTGSVGEDVYLVLLYGNGARDPLFLQVKEQDTSCWAPYLPKPASYASSYPDQGRRAAEAQLRTQTVADPFLGWTRIGRKDFLVRQWSDHKASVDVAALSSGTLRDYAILCGEVLAKAHARTGDAAVLAGYCGRSDRLDLAMARFASGYADQTEWDAQLLRKAIDMGRLKAVESV